MSISQTKRDENEEHCDNIWKGIFACERICQGSRLINMTWDQKMNEKFNRGISIEHELEKAGNQTRVEIQGINAIDYIVTLLGLGSACLSWFFIRMCLS